MVIIQLYKNFVEYGGAEKVAIEIHKGFKQAGCKSFLMGSNPFQKNNSKYNVNKSEYIKFNLLHIFKLKNATIFSHHRKNTTILYFLNIILRLNLRLIHVAHNEFNNLKYLSFYPQEIITVSQRVKDNLISFFNINAENITVIYNGLPDLYNSTKDKYAVKEKIKILYAARITTVKGQVELVKNFKGKLNNNIQIDFAGIGENYEELLSLTQDEKHFQCIGFADLSSILYKYNYVMLFSSNEGLPLTLIESCSFKKPIICNDIGGNIEIVEDGVNGFVVNHYPDLLQLINNGLPSIDSESYRNMSTNARKTFEDKFVKEQMIENYIKFIENKTHVS
jgi:glycosyltransferase involved in cell wall biosynthesis